MIMITTILVRIRKIDSDDEVDGDDDVDADIEHEKDDNNGDVSQGDHDKGQCF